MLHYAYLAISYMKVSKKICSFHVLSKFRAPSKTLEDSNKYWRFNFRRLMLTLLEEMGVISILKDFLIRQYKDGPGGLMSHEPFDGQKIKRHSRTCHTTGRHLHFTVFTLPLCCYQIEFNKNQKLMVYYHIMATRSGCPLKVLTSNPSVVQPRPGTR